MTEMLMPGLFYSKLSKWLRSLTLQYKQAELIDTHILAVTRKGSAL